MALSLLAGAHAEQQASSEGFQCRNPSSNETMSLLDILDNVFDSVSLGFATDKCKNQKLFVPKTTNWHVFAIEETEAPRICKFQFEKIMQYCMVIMIRSLAPLSHPT